MSRVLTLCMLELKRVFLKPSAYIQMFALPIIFTMIFGGLFSGTEEASSKYEFLYLDEDQSTASKQLIASLQQNKIFTISEGTREQAQKLLEAKEVQGLVTINKGFQASILENHNPEVIFTHGPELEATANIHLVISNTISELLMKANASTVWSQYSEDNWDKMFLKLAENDLHTSEQSVYQMKEASNNDSNAQMSNVSARALGFTMMFVMIMMMSATGVLIEARVSGVWYRLLSTPITRLQVMFGYLLSFFLIGWIQFGLLLIGTTYLFDVKWGNLVGIIALVSMTLLAVIGLGLFIASIVKTPDQQAALGTLVITASCMLGGVFWPLDIVPSFMQTVARFVPQTWAMEGFTILNVRGGTITDLGEPLFFLGIFAVIFLGFGVSRVKYE